MNSVWFPKWGEEQSSRSCEGVEEGSSEADAREGQVRAGVVGPDGGNGATLWGSLWISLRRYPKAHRALGAWPSPMYLLEVWADVTGSNEPTLLLGQDPGRVQAARFGNKTWQPHAKDTPLFSPFLKEALGSWVYFSQFLGDTFLHFYMSNYIWP